MSEMESLFLVRQNRPILGLWVSGRTDGRNFEKTIFQNPLPQVKSIKKRLGKNTRAFRLVRTESIPLVFWMSSGKIVLNWTKDQEAKFG